MWTPWYPTAGVRIVLRTGPDSGGGALAIDRIGYRALANQNDALFTHAIVAEGPTPASMRGRWVSPEYAIDIIPSTSLVPQLTLRFFISGVDSGTLGPGTQSSQSLVLNCLRNGARVARVPLLAYIAQTSPANASGELATVITAPLPAFWDLGDTCQYKLEFAVTATTRAAGNQTIQLEVYSFQVILENDNLAFHPFDQNFFDMRFREHLDLLTGKRIHANPSAKRSGPTPT